MKGFLGIVLSLLTVGFVINMAALFCVGLDWRHEWWSPVVYSCVSVNNGEIDFVQSRQFDGPGRKKYVLREIRLSPSEYGHAVGAVSPHCESWFTSLKILPTVGLLDGAAIITLILLYVYRWRKTGLAKNLKAGHKPFRHNCL